MPSLVKYNVFFILISSCFRGNLALGPKGDACGVELSMEKKCCMPENCVGNTCQTELNSFYKSVCSNISMWCQSQMEGEHRFCQSQCEERIFQACSNLVCRDKRKKRQPYKTVCNRLGNVCRNARRKTCTNEIPTSADPGRTDEIDGTKMATLITNDEEEGNNSPATIGRIDEIDGTKMTTLITNDEEEGNNSLATNGRTEEIDDEKMTTPKSDDDEEENNSLATNECEDLKTCRQKCKNKCPTTKNTECEDLKTCRQKCRNKCPKTKNTDNSSNNVPIGAIIGLLCLVILVVAGLITVCYWIKKANQGNRSNLKSSTVRYAPRNRKVDLEGQTSVATQPLSPIPVGNNNIPPSLQQYTYEQIDPQYTDLQHDQNATTNTILQPNNHSITNCNSLKTSKAKSETLLNSDVLKDKATPAYYTLQRDDNSDVTETSHTTDANDNEVAGNDYAKLRQNCIEEESYSKLNHNSRKSIPDDATGDYNKLIPTHAFDEESEEYSHLNRTSSNVEKSVTDTSYGKLNPSIEPAECTAKSNDGYDENLPGDVIPEYVTPEGSEQLWQQLGAKIQCEKANLNNGYQEVIIGSSDQLKGNTSSGRDNGNNGYEEAIVNQYKDN